MSRRNPGSAATPNRKTGLSPKPHGDEWDDDPDAFIAAWIGERLRRVALGATAALLTARAYWTSEPDLRADAGGGLGWLLALLIVAGLALAGALAGGHLRWRWSWADLAVVVLVVLVGASANHSVDRRVAINLAWEWAGLAIAYLLVRNLPQTRGESLALAAGLLATAVALSVYGLWQIGVELPYVQHQFRTNETYRLRALDAVGILPGTNAELLFRNRLLGSNEPYSTFALANSLAGFLVGPLVIMLAIAWDNLTSRDGRGSRLGSVLLALFPIASVLICLTLTKSRSAYIGLGVAMIVLAWRERRRLPSRTLLFSALVAAMIVIALIDAGLATRRLDLQVVTQAGKSLRYRQEYWLGAWRAINESSRSFMFGYGPGNFAAPYLRHKLPEASEEISDPHNLILEVWSTAGVFAPIALFVAVAIGLGNTLLPSRPPEPEWDASELPSPAPKTRKPPSDPSAPPASAAWLFGASGMGWIVVLLLGEMDLIGGGNFDRWMILGAAWVLATGCGVLLWRRRPLDPAVFGIAALAVLVNLLAAGGISVTAVALALWSMIALGLNLRDDRPCGRLRGPLGRLPAFAVAAVWAALLGTFIGAVTPYWKVEAEFADAEEALRLQPPNFERAERAYIRAKDADRFSPRAWLAYAALEYRMWDMRGAKFSDDRWRKIPIEMLKAVTGDRPGDSWSRHRERARMTNLLIKRLGKELSPHEAIRYRADVVNASRTATRLYPTNASLRASLAEACAEIGTFSDALVEGREALRLDKLTPHADKKLEPEVRKWLQARLPVWEESAKQAEMNPAPKSTPKPAPAPAQPAPSLTRHDPIPFPGTRCRSPSIDDDLGPSRPTVFDIRGLNPRSMVRPGRAA